MAAAKGHAAQGTDASETRRMGKQWDFASPPPGRHAVLGESPRSREGEPYLAEAGMLHQFPATRLGRRLFVKRQFRAWTSRLPISPALPWSPAWR